MFTIELRSNLKEFTKSVNAFAKKQIPYATAQALNGVAKQIIAAEQANERAVLDRPTPFTQNAIRFRPASKGRPVATVFMLPRAAAYLAPYEFGGRSVPAGKAFLKPVDAVKDLDQYGNLPRKFVARLRGRTDIFVGTVNTKAGPVRGVWQRTVGEGAKSVAVARVGKDGRVRVGKTAKTLNKSGHLKLLVRFEDGHPIRQHLDWFGVATDTAARTFPAEFSRALDRALATAR